MRSPEFKNISRIIKQKDFAAIKSVDFQLNEDESNFAKAKIILDLDGDDEFSIVINGNHFSVHVNGKMLFTIDDEYTREWKIYAEEVYKDKN